MVGAAFIQARGGEISGGQTIADKQDDPERFLLHPVVEVEKPDADKGEQTGEREQLVAEFQAAQMDDKSAWQGSRKFSRVRPAPKAVNSGGDSFA